MTRAAPLAVACGAAVVLWCGTPASALGQVLPAEPVSFGNGRVVLGGDVAVAVSPDDEAFFSYGEYEHSTLREVRFGLTAQVHASRRVSLLADIRSENFSDVVPFALYARIRPLPERRLDIQVGRVPPTFGRFSRLAYSTRNPLIGYPLAYQYLTSLRPDALPASTDELVQAHGRGWRSAFTIGDPNAAPGVPLVSALRWDTGVQVTGGWKALTMTGSATTGTLSNPRVGDDNDGRQLAGRVSLAATPGLDIGASFARGAFVSRHALKAVGGLGSSSGAQTAAGLDLEYGRGHLLARAEAVWSEWEIPLLAQRRIERLRAASIAVEGRYALMPGVYTAVRAEHLGFSEVVTAAGRQPWEAPVVRVEIGVGYYLQRNLVLRGSLQLNERDVRPGLPPERTGRVTSARLPAAQLLYWF